MQGAGGGEKNQLASIRSRDLKLATPLRMFEGDIMTDAATETQHTPT